MDTLIASAASISILADLSTIAACVIAVLALGFSSWQFRATQKATRESQAVELFLKFNQLNIEQGQNTSEHSDFWYGNSKFAITESLYEISHSSKTWLSTIRWMLKKQESFIDEGGFDDVTYSEGFRRFCNDCGFNLIRDYSKKQ